MIDCLLCLSGIFVEGAIGYVQPIPDAQSYSKHGERRVWHYDPQEAANPMGRITVGHEWETGKFRISLELRHESWIGTSHDYGQNSAWGSVRWRPFR